HVNYTPSLHDALPILGVADGASYIASDVPAILKYTRNVYYIGNMEMACVKKGEIIFYNLDGDEIQKEMKVIEWDSEAAEKAGYRSEEHTSELQSRFDL